MDRHTDYINILQRMHTGQRNLSVEDVLNIVRTSTIQVQLRPIDSLASILVACRYDPPDGNYKQMPYSAGKTVNIAFLVSHSDRTLRLCELSGGFESKHTKHMTRPSWNEICRFAHRTEAEDNLLKLKAGQRYQGIVNLYERMINVIDIGMEEELNGKLWMK